jgi:tRNA nucleotidyltransferase/poly(A) polymerase
MRDLIDGPATAPILDLTGHGLQDLRRGLIRCPKNPDIVFSDDPTRMLRLVKFVGRYGFSVAPEVAASVQRNASKMAQMPYEAIGTILVRDILQKPYAVRVLPMMQSLGLISALSGIAAQNPSFRTYLTRELRTLPIGLILALWRSGFQDPTPLSILSPEQQAQFVQVAQQMTEEEAQFLFDRLRKPPVDNEALIKAFSLRPAERGQLVPLARNLMLADPTLEGQRLTSAMAHILSTRA